jgi:hypothetical protein
MNRASISVSPGRWAGLRQSPAHRGWRAGSTLAGLALLTCALGLGCAGSDRASAVPQTHQPERTRSSDGDVVGANGQSPEDTLEGGLTTDHPAPGWEVKDGQLVRQKEPQNPGEPGEPKQPSALDAMRERGCIADSQQEAKAEASAGANAEPAPRALKRNLKPGCPKPPEH